MGDIRELLAGIARSAQDRFVAGERIKSFGQFLGDVASQPYLYTRSAPQYLLAMIDHYGAEEVTGIGGPVTRYRVFDAAFDGGRDRVHGQEQVQAEIYQTLRNFVQTGRNDRLILMHGPNGSAKSTIVSCLLRGLEAYSRVPEGVLYRFHWVFPTQKYLGRRVGFEPGADEAPAAPDTAPTYAFLEFEEIAARLPCELKDHPLFLLPREERRRFLEDIRKASGQAASEWILGGNLCVKCRAIYEALRVAYHGDLARVLAHVQVERFFVSRRYRQGAVTIDPQVTADGTARQITVDRSLSELPSFLQNVSLFEPMGDLVDANLGVVEFSDLLKRSTEANKYLLTACETGFVTLGSVAAQLNVVMIASGNEKHLDLFKKSPDFTSFKGRFRLLPTPYLLEYKKEARIYDDQLSAMTALKHLAPHTSTLAALWAVLTRLRRADPTTYPSEVRDIVRKLTPMQKAKLYDQMETPPHLDAKEKNALRAVVRDMREEFRDDPRYEGRYGASPREMRDILLDCFYDKSYACVSPLSLFEALGKLVQDRTLYEFLSLEPDNHYHDPGKFIEDVREEYLDRVNEEVRDSLELVAEDEYVRLFERYVLHVKGYVKHEKLYADVTQSYEVPDEALMAQVERVLDVRGDPAAFRATLIGRIGAFIVDNPGKEIDYQEVFPELLSRLKEDFYRGRKKVIEQISRHLLRVGTDEFGTLEPDVQLHVQNALDRMKERYGYCERCAKEAIVHLIRRRYS